MATGLEMLDALRAAIERLGAREIEINTFDRYDLCKLRPGDLVARGIAPEAADRISWDLFKNASLEELGKELGVRLIPAKHARNLIPGESLRRSAERLKDDPHTLDEIFRELDQIRHPEDYAK